MRLAKNSKDQRTVAVFAISPALEKFAGGQMVNSQVLEKLLSHEEVHASNMREALFAEADAQNLKAVRKLQSNILWKALKEKGLERRRIRPIIDAFEVAMGQRGRRDMSLESIQTVMADIGYSDSLKSEIEALQAADDLNCKNLEKAFRYLTELADLNG